MRLLVTGGCGFIGSHVVRHALGAGAQVTNLDLLTYAGRPENVADVAGHPGYRFVRGDVRDRELLSALLPEHDAVMHLAAESHVDRSIDDADAFMTTNVVGTNVLLDLAMRAGIERFLLASTDEVYGSVPTPTRAAEDAPLQPSSPYSASKAGADLLARAYRETHGYPVTVTRASNTYGPFQYPEKLVPLFVTNLLEGLPVPVYGSGGQVRDWLHVADHVAALWLALTAGTPGTVYNVGAGADVTNLELTRLLLAATGRDQDLIRFVDDRPGHDLRYSVDPSRIHALGWRPSHRLEEGLEATVRWYREHEDWWRPLKRAGASRRRGATAGAAGGTHP